MRTCAQAGISFLKKIAGAHRKFLPPPQWRPTLGIKSDGPIQRGRFMRRHASGIGCGARGRGMNAPPKLPGGAGTPPGGTTTPCEELADGGPSGQPEASRNAATQKVPTPRSQRQGETVGQKARPGADKTSRWRAERRHAPATVREELQWSRRWARHPLVFRGGERGRRRTRRRQEYGRWRLRGP